MVRINPLTGTVERPWRQRDRDNMGTFVLGDPAHGNQKHHKENAVFADSYCEALELVRRGLSIRMSDGRSAASLVSPGSIQFIDEPVKFIDDLWTYTMPEPPFPLEKVMDELRAHLLSLASDISVIADEKAAYAFIGFEFDTRMCERETWEQVDLERFNIGRITRAAYESAFRPWPSAQISEEDVDELEQIIGGSIVRHSRRHASPLDWEESALRRTLLAAYYRWQIYDGCFLSSEVLDAGATEAIAVLTGMPPSTVRNAISRDGISLVKSKLDREAVTRWVLTRRNFAPLREDETIPAWRAWRLLHHFFYKPLQEALIEGRGFCREVTAELEAAEQAILASREAGQMPSEQDLRRYAKATCVSADTFIRQIRQHWA